MGLAIARYCDIVAWVSICSVQCPGSVVIKTFDAIRELRDLGITVVGGFHSPMEKECLEFLLRGEQPVIIVPAIGLTRSRLTEPWRKAIDDGRLLLLSPFTAEVRRTTRVNAQLRNEFVAAFATAVLIPHASPGGKTDSLAHALLKRGQPLFTFDDDENRSLLQDGALPFKSHAIRSLLTMAAANETDRQVESHPKPPAVARSRRT